MARLTKDELAECKTSLSKWLLPAEFDALRDQYYTRTDKDLFIQPGLEFLREAYSASKLAAALKPEKIRLCTEKDYPDFEFLTGDKVDLFEMTEVLDPERRRSDEYKYPDKQPQGIVPIPERLFESSEIISSLQKACLKKSAKEYEGAINLVICLHDYWPWDHEEEYVFMEGTKTAATHFSSIFVHTSSTVYQTYLNSAPSYKVQSIST